MAIRRALTAAAVLVLFAAVPAAATSAVTLNSFGCATSFDVATDYFPIDKRLDGSILDAAQSVVQVASLFQVAYRNSFKFAYSLATNETFVLYQCGTVKPSADTLRELFPLSFSNATKFFQVPVQTVATGLTTTLNFLEVLGVRNKIAVLDMTFVTSPCAMRLTECGKIKHVDAYSANWTSAVADVDLVLTDKWGTGASGTDKDVAFDATIDPGLLNRAEWVKFLALFFNAESTANALFRSDQAGVQSVTGASANLSAAAAGPRPLVAFVRHTEANAAYGQEEDWEISFAPFKLEFVSLAGGRTMPRPSGFAGDDLSFGSVAAWKEAVAGVDVLIDETYAADARTFSLSTVFQVYNFSAADVASGRWPFLTRNRIFREDRTISAGTYSRGLTGMDWYESATTSPDLVLRDFVAALFPGAAPQFNSTRWLRNLARGDDFIVVNSQMCTDPVVDAVCPPLSVPPLNTSPPPAAASPPPRSPAAAAPKSSGAGSSAAVKALLLSASFLAAAATAAGVLSA